jgi:hypothetical protein
MAKLIGLDILPTLKNRISDKFLGKDSVESISSTTIETIINNIENNK